MNDKLRDGVIEVLRPILRQLLDEERERMRAEEPARPRPARVVEAPSRPKSVMMSRKEVCEMLGVSASTLWRWGQAGEFPAAIRLGPKRVAWRRNEVEDWIESRRGF